MTQTTPSEIKHSWICEEKAEIIRVTANSKKHLIRFQKQYKTETMR